MKLNDLCPLTQETLKGTYRLTGRVACFDDEGIPYLKLRLSSCASDIVVLAVIGSILIPENLGHMDLVVVKGQVCVGAEESEILLTDIRRRCRQTLPACRHCRRYLGRSVRSRRRWTSWWLRYALCGQPHYRCSLSEYWSAVTDWRFS